MNGGDFKQSLAARIAAFIKRSRQNTAVRRITNVMAVFVVFITTYMMILPAITLETKDLSPTLSVTSIKADNVEYNGTDYTAELTVSISTIANADSSTTYYVVFPDGVSITNYSGSTLTGTSTISGQTVDAFTYVYKYDDDGTLYAEVQFLQSYLDEAGNNLSDGWFYFDATIDSSNEDADYNVVLNTGTVTYTIAPTSIESTDNSSNPAGDVTVSKTSSSYNKDTNSITYTLKVSSEKGTQSAISILDTITSDLNVSSVTLDSLSLWYYTDEWGNSETKSTITDSSVLSSLYLYNASTGEITMTLDALTDGNGYGSWYVITYTVYLDTITDYSTSETVANAVTASANTGWPGTSDPTVTSDSSATAAVSYNVLSKTGAADSDGNITWVITVNADGVNIYGLTLTDEMFSQFYDYQLAAGITGGSQGNDYTFTYDSYGKVTGITFINNSGSTNTGTYTITYTTSATSAWADGSVTTQNTATLSGSSMSSAISKSVGVTTQSGGIGKTVDESATTYSSDRNYAYLTWTATATIPSGGITKGTVLYDYLGGSGAYASQTNQWFTYAQIADATARNTWYSMNLTYSSGQVDTLNYNSDYSVEFYCTDTGAWVSLQDLVSNESTYISYHFTAIRITFLKDITVSGSATLSLTYTTTADRSTIDGSSVTSITYTNNLEVQGTTTLYGSASHTEYANVIKTDGSGTAGSSNTTVDADGTLTWIVKAYVPAGTTDTSYTITDTLPENVELTSVKVDVSGTNCTMTPDANGELSGTLNSGTVTGIVVTDDSGGTDVQVVTVTIPDTSYSGLVSSGGYITLTYTCQLDSSLLTDNGDPLADGTVVDTFENSVSVSTSGSASFGTAVQAQTVTYYENTGAGTDDTVTKNYVWSSDTSRLTYTVIINPDAEILANGENLSFEDILTVNHATDWGVYAQLVNATVRFYEAVSDGNGGYEKGDALDIAWTYTQSSADIGGSYISVYHTITSDSVPDGTAIILEYVYEVWLDPYDAAQATAGKWYDITGVGNSMTLEGTYTDSTNTTNSDKYTDSHMAAGIGTTGNYLMLVKVEDGNYSTTISGAVYTLYKYNGTDWDAIGTYTTGTDGTIVISKSSLGNDYATDTAFKLVETEAPTGYILDSQTEYYFYWSGTGTVSSPADGDGWDSVSAVNLTKTSDTLYANNTARPYVGVTKVWLDSDGNELTEALPESVTVELRRYRSTSSDYPASGTVEEDSTFTAQSITLNAENDWSASVYDLETSEDVSGTTWYYYYYFVETGVSGIASADDISNIYTVTYSSENSGVTPGTAKITVTNQEKQARTYVNISATKAWQYLDDSGAVISSKTVPGTATSEITLVLLRAASGGNTGGTADAELVDSITLDGTVDAYELAAWTASWSDLLRTYTDSEGNLVTYHYYIAEISDSSDIINTSFSGTSSTSVDLTVSGTTYTAYEITSFVENLNTGETNAEVAVTNGISLPEEKEVTAAKVWQAYDGSTADAPADVSVTFQLYLTDGTGQYKAGGAFDGSGTYEYTEGSASANIYLVTLDGTSASTNTYTDAAGDTITVTIDGWSVIWSGMDGAYDYYVVETSAKSGGNELSTGEDGYTTYYSADGGTTTGTNAADYAGMADETVSNAAGTENEYTVINRANSGTTELTVNKVFTGGTEMATAVYIQLWQVAKVTVTTASGEVTASTSRVQVTDTSYGTNTTQGGVFYYVLSASNNWSMDFSNLASSSRVTDTNGTVTETVYSYYVVETGASTSNTQDTCSNLDSYEVSYTAEDGSVATETVTFDMDGDGTDETAYLVKGGGVIITNADAYAILAIEKEWQYPDGTEADASTTDSATFELWREASYKEYSGTYYTVNVYYGTTLKATKLVPANTAVTITIPSSGLSGYNVYRGDDPSVTWSSTIIRSWGNTVPIELTADEVTNNINVYYWGTDGTCTISYENEDNDSGITVSTILEKIDEVPLNSTNAWTYNWQLETEGTITVGGTTYDCTYTYYLTETSAAFGDKTLADMTVQVADSNGAALTATTVTDSNGTTVTDAYAVTLGTTLTTVSATNQVPKEEEQTASVSVTKTWASSIQEASVTFTLIQLLVNSNSTSDSDKWIADSGNKVVVNASGTDIAEYTKTIDVTNSVAATATWSDLPTKATYNGESYECAYFIAETKVTNGTGGTGTDITGNYEAAYTYSNQVTSGLTTYTADSIVYYQVTADDPLTVTNTAQESVILPMTGGLGADRIIVFLGCGLALLAVCIFFVRRRILCGGGDCET